MPGHGAREFGTCWALMWTHPFFKYPRWNLGTVMVPEYKDETLCSGSKYGTWSLCAHRFGYFWGIRLFCTRCSGRNGVTVCTQLHIGFSRCEHDTILCWFRTPGVDNPLVKCERIFLPTLCTYQTDWYFRPHSTSKSKVQTKNSTHILHQSNGKVQSVNFWRSPATIRYRLDAT